MANDTFFNVCFLGKDCLANFYGKILLKTTLKHQLKSAQTATLHCWRSFFLIRYHQTFSGAHLLNQLVTPTYLLKSPHTSFFIRSTIATTFSSTFLGSKPRAISLPSFSLSRICFLKRTLTAITMINSIKT